MSTRVDPEFILKPGPQLDLETVERFRAETYAFLATDCERAIVDLSETREMDVAGLAALMHLLVLARQRRLRVALSGPITAEVARLLDYSGFGSLFETA